MCSYQKSQLFPSQLRFSLDPQIKFPSYHHINKVQELTKTPSKIPICLSPPHTHSFLIQNLNYTCAKDQKMLLSSTIKWEPMQILFAFLQVLERILWDLFPRSGSKFPSRRKAWLVRSRKTFGSHGDYSTGGEHEGENLITFCDRFQQRLELLSPTSQPGALLPWLS